MPVSPAHRFTTVLGLAMVVWTLSACDPTRPSATASPCAGIEATHSCQEAVPSADGLTCEVRLRSVGALCDDGNPCTEQTSCNTLAMCVGHALVCDDSDECTADSCMPGSGCAHEFQVGVTCDDGDPCTEGDACDGVQRECVPGPDICAACDVAAPDDCDQAFTPDNLCDGTVSCSAGKCALQTGSVPSACDFSRDNDCRTTGCDPETGECVTLQASDGEPCDDGNPCTVEDACNSEGDCVAGTLATCDDDDECTEDLCDGSLLLRGCVNITTCPCEVDEDCAQPPFGCLSAVCSETVCEFVITDDGPAECDNDLCTSGDQCAGGICEAGAPLECAQDGDACTAQACDPGSGLCASVPIGPLSCDDGSECTKDDLCDESGVCAGVAIACDDGLKCTLDTCDPASGCQHTPDDTQCPDPGQCQSASCVADAGCVVSNDTGACVDDGDLCTVGGTCTDGACVDGTPVVCDDGDICTVDSCDVVSGACSTTVDVGASCDDGDSCTADDVCGTDAVCTGAELTCDDEVPCTLDGCDSESGCTVTPLDAACPDSSECLVGVCNPDSGCTVTPADGGTCAPDEPCLVNGTCTAGVCEGGETNPCDDGDPCTDSACSTGVGCVLAPTCDDGNACTDDNCDAGDGACTYDETDCNDGDPCTNDGCEIGVGCTTEPASGVPCDDGSQCTGLDECLGGTCVGGNPGCGQGQTGSCLEAACNGDGETCYAFTLDGLQCGFQSNECAEPQPTCASGLCTTHLRQLSVGPSHACVRCPGGAAVCWGALPVAPGSAAAPVAQAPAVLPLQFTQNGLGDSGSSAGSIAAGTDFGCVTADWDQLYCWGHNELGQLGRGSLSAAEYFGPVSAPDDDGAWAPFDAVSGHESVCASGRCWGSNAHGELDPEVAEAEPIFSIPSQVPRLPVCIGRGFSCGLDVGIPSCWGSELEVESGVTNGALGDGVATGSLVVSPVQGLQSVETFACGGNHACALHVDGSVSCWGYNASGQVGSASGASVVHVASPVVMVGGLPLTNVQELVAGEEHTCARLDDCETVYCWGSNSFGQSGGVAGEHAVVAVEVELPAEFAGINVTQVAAGGDSTCVSFADRRLWCFGANSDGQLGAAGTQPEGVVIDLEPLCPVPQEIAP